MESKIYTFLLSSSLRPAKRTKTDCENSSSSAASNHKRFYKCVRPVGCRSARLWRGARTMATSQIALSGKGTWRAPVICSKYFGGFRKPLGMTTFFLGQILSMCNRIYFTFFGIVNVLSRCMV